VSVEELLRLGMTNNAVIGLVEGNVVQFRDLYVVYRPAAGLTWLSAPQSISVSTLALGIAIGIIVGAIIVYLWLSRSAQVGSQRPCCSAWSPDCPGPGD
jgi:hypothetical protein